VPRSRERIWGLFRDFWKKGGEGLEGSERGTYAVGGDVDCGGGVVEDLHLEGEG